MKEKVDMAWQAKLRKYRMETIFLLLYIFTLLFYSHNTILRWES